MVKRSEGMRLVSNDIVCEWKTCNVIIKIRGKEMHIPGRLEKGKKGSLKKEKRREGMGWDGMGWDTFRMQEGYTIPL